MPFCNYYYSRICPLSLSSILHFCMTAQTIESLAQLVEYIFQHFVLFYVKIPKASTIPFIILGSKKIRTFWRICQKYRPNNNIRNCQPCDKIWEQYFTAVILCNSVWNIWRLLHACFVSVFNWFIVLYIKQNVESL